MKVLYICTHNRCRSILSEAITNAYASEHIQAQSAGSQPAGEVHPGTLQYLQQDGINTDQLKSQSWHEMEAFAPDVVITLCDSAAGESCPLWFGNSVKVHWGLADPSKLSGQAQAEAFAQCIAIIKQRVTQLHEIAKQSPGRAELEAALHQAGASL